MQNNLPPPRELEDKIRALRLQVLDLQEKIRGRIIEIGACVNATSDQKAKLPELFAIQRRIHDLLRHIKAGKLPLPRQSKK